MQIPVIRGIIDRRILVNFRVNPDVLARFLPAPFRPKLVNGAGMAGVCLIRLKNIRPRFLPSFLGISSENAAHRIAVECAVDPILWARKLPKVSWTSSAIEAPRRVVGAGASASAAGGLA